MKRNELVNHLNNLLKLGDFAGDVSNNGLQVEGADEVTKIAYGVDASLAMAIQADRAGLPELPEDGSVNFSSATFRSMPCICRWTRMNCWDTTHVCAGFQECAMLKNSALITA